MSVVFLYKVSLKHCLSSQEWQGLSGERRCGTTCNKASQLDQNKDAVMVDTVTSGLQGAISIYFYALDSAGFLLQCKNISYYCEITSIV